MISPASLTPLLRQRRPSAMTIAVRRTASLRCAYAPPFTSFLAVGPRGRECPASRTSLDSLRKADRDGRRKRPRTRVQALVGRASTKGALFRLTDRDLQGADAVDAAFDLVAGVELGDAGRRSRHDDVAGSKRDLLRKLPDDLRHVPDQ